MHWLTEVSLMVMGLGFITVAILIATTGRRR